MLSVRLGKVRLDNPTILASGFLGTTANLLKRVSDSGAGAVTIKSIGPFERDGNKNPTVLEWEHGLINAVGLPNAGYKNMDDELKSLSKFKRTWIASVYGSSVEDYVTITNHVKDFKPDMIELNISCPNKSDGTLFGTDPNLSKKLVSAVRKITNIPLIAKLTPNVTDIVSIAKACEDGGADAINAINTLTGMVIDVNARKPVLAFKTGGMSGPAIRPLAVRCVYQIFPHVKIPIIGTGGINTYEDALEMMMAGASAVSLGTAIHYNGMGVFSDVCNGMKKWLKDNGYKSVKDIIGIAHE